MRTIIGVLLFCLISTRALSEAAVSFGASGNNDAFHGISVNQKTRELAITAANAQCSAQTNGRYVSEQCAAQRVFRDRCVTIIELRTTSERGTLSGVTLYAETGSDERDARINAVALCNDIRRVYGGLCQIRTTACDGSTGNFDGWLTAKFDAVHSWWTNTIGDIRSWWDDNVTTTTLVVSAAFIILSAGLLYTSIQLIKLKRMIAPAPTARAGQQQWWPFGAFSAPWTTASRKDQGPLKGPVLDESTIREAFGQKTTTAHEASKPSTKRREEFEI